MSNSFNDTVVDIGDNIVYTIRSKKLAELLIAAYARHTAKATKPSKALHT